jgi:hypothetical protein
MATETQNTELTPEIPETPTPDATHSPGALNAADVKKIPWVQEALQSKSKLEKLERDLAESKRLAEVETLTKQGKYEEALAAEKARIDKISAEYQAKLDRVTLESEFLKVGLTDPRAVRMFEGDRTEGEDIAIFVSRMRADPSNALYFGDPKRRTVAAPPPPANGGGIAITGKKHAIEMLESGDPSKRSAASAWLRQRWVDDHP